MIAQVMTGLGLVVAGTAIGVHASHRRPLPADLAAQMKAALGSGSDLPLEQLKTAWTTALNGKWRYQAEIVYKAFTAGKAGGKLPADVAALYQAALKSADPATMKQIAITIKTKQPHLAGNLNDVAKILGG
jgi:hypothetical protein